MNKPQFKRLIEARTSYRTFSSDPISWTQLEQIHWAMNGMLADGRRAAPSAFGAYTLETRVVAGNVSPNKQGIYTAGSGEPLTLSDTATTLAELEDAAVGDQPWIKDCAATFSIIGNPEQFALDNAEGLPPSFEAERYLYIEAGAIAQNGALMAAELQLGAVLVAGFDTKRISDALRLSSGQRALLHLCIGSRR